MLSKWLHQYFAFSSRVNQRRFVVLAIGMVCAISWALGQDSNWDLRNYHLYNAYALLQGRVGQDFAAAGLQSYFPPMLDVPYYWLAIHATPALLAIIMGAWHGLSLLLIVGISSRLLQCDPHRAVRVPALSLACLLSAALLSELGSTMGDASTAPPILASLYLLIRRGVQASWLDRWLAGALLGLAVGLKLSNGFYAIAMAAAILAAGGSWQQRIKTLLTVTAASVLAFSLLTGAWFHHMWVTFGNPLLPQFNNWFQSPLASATMIADTRWLPKSTIEWLSWPLLMSLDPGRVGEANITQIVWPVLQLLLIGAGLKAGWARIWRIPPASSDKPDPARRQVLIFVLVAFVCWMAVFSIHRYLVVAEMLAPLAIWILATGLLPGRAGVRLGKSAVVAAVVVAVLGWNTWGHAPLSDKAFRVEWPEGVDPAPATVVLSGKQPQAWMLPFMPASYRYVGLGSTSFAEGPGYIAHAQAIWEQTPERIFAILPASIDARQQRVVRYNRLLRNLGIGGHCRLTGWLADKLRLTVIRNAASAAAPTCDLAVPVSRRTNTLAEDAKVRAEVAALLESYGLRLLVDSCEVKQASIGGREYSYQWCRASNAAARAN